MRIGVAGAVTAMLAVACGGGTTNDKVDPGSYAALAQSISTTASRYGTAAQATTDVPGCQAAQATYDGQVRPMVQRMHTMSGGMDHEMETMGHAADADMTCGADAMMAELDHHAAMACASTTMSDDHAEAARHAAAMMDWADHQQARADDMSGMMGGSMMGGGTTTETCHRNGDGTFTLGP